MVRSGSLRVSDLTGGLGAALIVIMFLKSGSVFCCLALAVFAGLYFSPGKTEAVAQIMGASNPLNAAVPASGLTVILDAVEGALVSTVRHELKRWDIADLSKFKQVSTQEKDPVTGKLANYKGVLLSHVLEQAMESVSPDQKAQVDLVVFRNPAGGQVLVPRSVITKYPVLLGVKDGKTTLVMPWTSKPRLMQEGLPVVAFFLADVTRVELTNYRERFGNLFLKRRTDPLAMRGEKIFVQNCVSCHATGQGNATLPHSPSVADLSVEARAHRLATVGHPVVEGAPKLDERDRRALVNYLDRFRAESASKTAKPEHSSSQVSAPVASK